MPSDRKISQDYARSLLSDNAPVMLWLSDDSGRCIFLNRRLRAFWGVANEQLEAFDWIATMHPDDAERVGSAVARAYERQEGFKVEARFRNHDGAYRVLRTEAEPSQDDGGNFLGFIGVNVDITDQVEALQAHERAEERFSRFMAHLPGLAWIKDEDGRYVFANQAAAAAFGRPVAEILGRRDDELFPANFAAQFSGNDARARGQQGFRGIESLPQPDGVLHHSIVSKFPIPEGDGKVLTGGVAIDVTDHKTAEDQIRQLNEDLRHQLEEREILLAALPVGVSIAHDRDCATITMNDAGAAMLRLPRAANASKSGPDAAALSFRVVKGGQDVQAHDLAMQRATRRGVPILGEEVDVEFADGSVITLHESVTPLRDDTGQVRGCVAVFVDISERKRAERQMALLIDELNHRAKNTIAIVQSIASQTLRQTPDPKLFGPAFSERLDALARAHGLLTETEWRGAPLDQLVAAALKPFQTGEGRIAMDGPAVVIKAAVAVTLSLVFHELATNAVKHGALKEPTGRLQIAWSIEGGKVKLVWSETCVAPLRATARKGFGTRLVTASASQLGGAVNLDYRPDGLVARLTFEI